MKKNDKVRHSNKRGGYTLGECVVLKVVQPVVMVWIKDRDGLVWVVNQDTLRLVTKKGKKVDQRKVNRKRLS